MTTLHAFREDGTKVLPGETITMTGITHTFRAATRISNDAGTDGMIAVDGYPEMFSAPYGLTVRAVPGQPDEPAPRAGEHRAWTDSEIPDNALDRALGPVTEPEPSMRDLHAILADLDKARTGTDAINLYHELEDEVRAQLAPIGNASEMAAEADRAARTTAPPVPGVTRNAGHTVYAVIRVNHVPGEPSDDAWIVAAANDRGEHVTWKAYASDDSSGRLHYDSGHYHSSGEGAKAEALADLADRAGVFTGLTGLSSGTVTREVFQASHEQVLEELAGSWGVGRARVRAGLLEAAALGYARISWHAGSRRQDYGIRYDRYRCIFTWAREN